VRVLQLANRYNNKTQFLHAFKLVFSNWSYILMSILVTIFFWVIFSSFDQLLFFSPIPAFYVPNYAIPDFIVSTATAGLLGIIISMNVYSLRRQYRMYKAKNTATAYSQGKDSNKNLLGITVSIFSGSSLGVLSSMCASCTSYLGFALLSIFGSGLGTTLSTFMTNYQFPLRITTLIILLWSFYSVSRSLMVNNCSLRAKIKK
jgi:hypothetical protein